MGLGRSLMGRSLVGLGLGRSLIGLDRSLMGLILDIDVKERRGGRGHYRWIGGGGEGGEEGEEEGEGEEGEIANKTSGEATRLPYSLSFRASAACGASL